MVALIDECPRANEALIRLDSNRRIWLYSAFVLHLNQLSASILQVSPLNWSAIRRYLIRGLQMSEVLDDSPGAGRADKRF